MKRLVLVVLLSVSIVAAYCQDNAFADGMKIGFDSFNSGEHYDDWIGAAESLATLADSYSNEWLSYYWASYMYTQIARSARRDKEEGIDPEKMLDKAQLYLNKASSRIKDKTPSQEVEIHMLQRLTYAFRKAPVDDNEKFIKLQEKELASAVSKDPYHPLLLVNIGLDLFRKGDLQSVYAARALLLEAKEKFNQRLKPRYMSTHYVEQWVGYWEPQTQKKILELVSN